MIVLIWEDVSWTGRGFVWKTWKKTKWSLTPDVSQGFAIFLVIWGHVIQQGLNGVTEVAENVMFKWIYSFHMPLFMIISGFFFFVLQKRKIASWLKYVAVAPYFVGMAFYFSVPAAGNSEIKGLLDTCIATIKGQSGISAVFYQMFRTALFYFLGITGSITVIVLADRFGRKVGKTSLIGILSQIGSFSLEDRNEKCER